MVRRRRGRKMKEGKRKENEMRENLKLASSRIWIPKFFNIHVLMRKRRKDERKRKMRMNGLKV